MSSVFSQNRAIFRGVRGLGLVVWCLLGMSAAAAASAPPNPYGLMCLLNSDSVANPFSLSRLESEPCWTNPNVTGVVLRTQWDRIEPSQGNYYWSFLDTGTALALQYNKKFEIVVIAGLSTPQWAYDLGLSSYAVIGEAGAPGNMPKIWDPIFQTQFGDVIQQIGSRYSSSPNLFYVLNAGAGREAEADYLESTDTAALAQFGAEATVSTWTVAASQLLDKYVAAFPHTPIMLASGNPTPTTNCGGLVTYGTTTYGAQFGLMSDGLYSGNPSPAEYVYQAMTAMGGSYPIGFQNDQAFNGNNGLAASFNYAVNTLPGEFIEVYSTDSNNPVYTSTMAFYNAYLDARYAPPLTIAITTPTTGSDVSGLVAVSGTASDALAISSVAVAVDGGAYSQASGTASWTYTLNAANLSDGPHVVTAIAYDASGRTSTATVPIVVGPLIAISTPSAGAVVQYKLALGGTSSSGVGVSSVAVSVDGLPYAIATGTSSWGYILNTLSLSNGAHTVTALVTDEADATSTSTITIQVNNPALPNANDQQSSASRGVYSVQNPGTAPLQALLSNTNVDGILLRTGWVNVQPNSSSQYDWSFIDSSISSAAAAGKKLSLDIATGHGTPQWVYSAGASSFSYVVTGLYNTYFCDTEYVPVPWDPVYQAALSQFIQALGNRYDANPTVSHVKIEAISSATDETILPNSTGGSYSNGTTSCTANNQVTAWQGIGYTRTRVENAWLALADVYAQSFPHKGIALMGVPNAFPTIDDFGNIFQPESQGDPQLPNDLVSLGSSRYGSQFIGQNNGMSGFFIWSTLTSIATQTATGYQMLYYVVGDPTCRMNNGVKPCSPYTELSSAVVNGIQNDAKYLEIYEQDIDSAPLNSVIALAHSSLTATGQDVTPPTLSIKAPANGAVISGIVSISGTAADNLAVSNIVIAVDSGAYSLAVGTASWTYSLNASNLTNGTHVIAAVASDSSGNTSSATVSVTVGSYALSALPLSSVSTGSLAGNWSSSFPAGTTYYAVLSTGVLPNSFSANLSSVTANLSVLFSGLGPNTTYFGEVAAYSVAAGTWTAFIPLGSTSTLAGAPAAAAIAFPAVSTNSMSVDWAADGNPLGVTTYTVVLTTGSIYPNSFSGNVSLTTAPAAAAASSAALAGLVPNTTYSLFVRALNWDGVATSWTSLGSTSTLASTPAAAAAAFPAVFVASMSVDWSAGGNPLNVTTYTVVLSTGPSYPNSFSGNVSLTTAPASTAASSATLTGLAANTTYFLFVDALNRNGIASAWTSLGSTFTLAAAPGSAIVTNVGSNSAALGWSTSTNPAGTQYEAQISTNDFATIDAASVTLNPSSTFSGLAANTTYFLRVEALNSAGAPTAFAVAAATSTKAAAPLASAPTNVTAGSATANWSADGNSATTVYVVQISTDGFGTVNASIRTSGTAATFSGLAANTAYAFEAAALGNDGSETAFTALPSTSTLLLAPAAAATPISPVTTADVTVNWTGGGNGAGTLYDAQISTDGFASVNFTSATLNLSATFGAAGAGAALGSNTTYYFRVQAATSTNSSSFLTLGSTATPAAVPGTGSPLFIAVDNAGLTVDWTANGNSTATLYSVELATTSGFSAIAASTQIAGVSAAFTGLIPNSTYFAQIAPFSSENDRLTAYSALGSTATTAPAPTGGAFTGVTASSLTANWGADGNPPGTVYQVQISTTPSLTSGTRTIFTTSVSTGFTGLLPNATYYGQVAAYGVNTGQYTSFTPLSPGVSTLADAPAAAAATAVDTADETLAWNANGNPAGTQYAAQISTNDFATINVTSLTTNVSSAFSNLKANTTYFLRVEALNSAGMPTAFAVATASSTKAAAPLASAPTNVTAGSATANWGPDGNSTGTVYVVQISTDGFGTVNASIRTSGTAATFSGLAANTAYAFEAAAIGNDGSETAFTTLPSTTTLLLPPAPAANPFLDVGYTSAAVQWTSGGNGPGTTYVAQISTNGSFAPVIFSSTTLNLTAVFGAGGAGPSLSPNTTYYFQVLATTGANSSPFAALGSTATAAYAPSGTALVSVTSTTVSLDWQSDGDPAGTSYELWRSTTSAFSAPIKTIVSTASFSASGLAANTTYFFQVRVLGNDGVYTAFDSFVSTMTLPPAPGAPGTPFIASLGLSSISWSWTAAQYSSSYQVFRASTNAILASMPAPAFLDAGLSTNTAYGLLVRGVDATGAGALSGTATFYTLAAPPTGALVTAVAATSAALSWSLNTNPAGTDAQVQRSTDGVDFASVAGSLTVTNLTDYGLLGCTTYYYRVQNANGNGLATSFDQTGPFVTSNTVPLPASNLSAQPVGGDRVALTWSPSPTEGVVGYQLFYDSGTGTVSYSAPLASLSGSATSYLTEVLPSSAAYTFALRAIHRCGVEETNGVFATAASTSAATLNAVRADIVSPGSGQTVYGTGLTVYAALVAGNPALTGQVLFRYRPHGAVSWSTMTAAVVGQPNPATSAPYFIHWDVTALAPGSYDLSAVAVDVSGSSDPAPDAITIVVDPAEANLVESVAGGLKQTFFTSVANTFNSGGAGTGGPLASITIPGGLINGSTASVTIAAAGTPPETSVPAGWTLASDLWVSVALSNGQSFLNGGTATVSFFSPTSPGLNPTIFSYNTTTQLWAQDVATIYTPATGEITGLTPHFTVFAVLTGGGAPAADLSSVRVYPIPYRPNGGNPDQGGGNTGIVFDQLPASAAIKIYTASGQLVTSFDASSPTGKAVWNAQNDRGRDVASGLYLAVITSPGVKSVTKKMLVIR